MMLCKYISMWTSLWPSSTLAQWRGSWSQSRGMRGECIHLSHVMQPQQVPFYSTSSPEAYVGPPLYLVHLFLYHMLPSPRNQWGGRMGVSRLSTTNTILIGVRRVIQKKNPRVERRILRGGEEMKWGRRDHDDLEGRGERDKRDEIVTKYRVLRNFFWTLRSRRHPLWTRGRINSDHPLRLMSHVTRDALSERGDPILTGAGFSNGFSNTLPQSNYATLEAFVLTSHSTS